MNLDTIVPMVITGISGASLSPVILGIINGRGARMKAKVDGDVVLKQQADKMLLEVMKVSEGQIEKLVARVATLEPLQDTITELRRALEETASFLREARDHLVALTTAETDQERRTALRRTLSFLKRLDAIDVVRAFISSDVEEPPADMRDTLKKLP